MLRRREFLITGSGAALAAPSPAPASSTDTLRNLSSSMPLAERIRIMESFVHNRYYDPAGLLYSHINFAEERPHREEDLAGADPNNLGIPKHHLQNYENSAMNSGIFLAAQCYRYMATQDPQALEYAAKAFRSIDVNYQLSEQAAGGPPILMQRAGSIDPNDHFAARPGWICKPYGGLLTTQTSSEQNFGPILGLWLYRKIAPETTRKRIDSMIVGVADLWREIGYKINFFGENWEFEKSMPRAQRHMPVWACINRIAYEVSGQRRFLAEFRRLDALFGAMPTAQQTNYGLGREKYVSTEDRAFHDKECIVADILMELEPASAPRYLRGMTGWWKFAQIGMDENYLSYYYIELNTVTGEWRPLPKSIKPRVQWNSPSMWQNGTFPVRNTEYAVRLSLTSCILARRNPDLAQQALKLAQGIFSKVDHGRMRYMHDPENCLEPSLKYLTNLISGDALAYYPAAYWYGRYHKLL